MQCTISRMRTLLRPIRGIRSAVLFLIEKIVRILLRFAAHNAAFDQQWLPPDLLGNLPLICTYKAAVHIWPEAPKHTNQVLRYWLDLDMDRSIADRAHRAMPDAYVTAHLLREILKHASIEDLIRWTNEPVLLPKVTFGKHRGQNWTDVRTFGEKARINKPDRNDVRGVAQMSCASQRGPARFLSQTRS